MESSRRHSTMPRSGMQAVEASRWARDGNRRNFHTHMMSKLRTPLTTHLQHNNHKHETRILSLGRQATARNGVMRLCFASLSRGSPRRTRPAECFTGPRAAGSFTAACSYACMCVCDSCLLMYRKKTRTYFRALSALAVAMASSDPDAWLAAVEEATCVLSDFDSHAVLACVASETRSLPRTCPRRAR